MAHKGLLKRVIGGHYGSCPKLGDMVSNNELEAFKPAKGPDFEHVPKAYRGKAGELSKIGMKTFVDPGRTAAKLNAIHHGGPWCSS
jgi:acyl CoA:acetate/3-ketoacid CoA transferase